MTTRGVSFDLIKALAMLPANPRTLEHSFTVPVNGPLDPFNDDPLPTFKPGKNFGSIGVFFPDSDDGEESSPLFIDHIDPG